MKAWINARDSTCDFFEFRLDEPEWTGDMGLFISHWRSAFGYCAVCGISLRKLGFKPLPKDNECVEYDLSGKKPRHVCTWEPL